MDDNELKETAAQLSALTGKLIAGIDIKMNDFKKGASKKELEELEKVFPEEAFEKFESKKQELNRELDELNDTLTKM